MSVGSAMTFRIRVIAGPERSEETQQSMDARVKPGHDVHFGDVEPGDVDRKVACT